MSPLSRLFRDSSRIKVIFLSGRQQATFKSHESSQSHYSYLLWDFFFPEFSPLFSFFPFSQGQQSNLRTWSRRRCLCFGEKFHLSRHESRWRKSYKNVKGNCKKLYNPPAGWCREDKNNRRVYSSEMSTAPPLIPPHFQRKLKFLLNNLCATFIAPPLEQIATAWLSEPVLQLPCLWK